MVLHRHTLQRCAEQGLMPPRLKSGLMSGEEIILQVWKCSGRWLYNLVAKLELTWKFGTILSVHIYWSL